MTRGEESQQQVDGARSVLASDGDLLSEVLRLGLERLTKAEQATYVNAGRHERTEGGRTRRNGYRTRTLETRAEELELEVPRTRDREFGPSLPQRYQRSEKALVAALAEWLEMEGEETLSCFRFPSTHRLRIRTTNGMERLNQEIKRRSRIVRIFPSRQSCGRLAAARLKEHHEDWITGRRYIDMSPFRDRNFSDEVAGAVTHAA